jgi:hypothetical protein
MDFQPGQEIDIFVWLNPGASDVREWITVEIVKIEDAPRYYAVKDGEASCFGKEPGCCLTLRYPGGEIRGPGWWSRDSIREPVW